MCSSDLREMEGERKREGERERERDGGKQRWREGAKQRIAEKQLTQIAVTIHSTNKRLQLQVSSFSPACVMAIYRDQRREQKEKRGGCLFQNTVLTNCYLTG